jgi:hypothetical protein
MNYWYVARPNELFLDIDNVSKSIKHARSRLQGAIECGKLDVVYVMQRPSKSKDHIHVIITIKGDSSQDSEFYTNETTRRVWEIILHGDIYRGCCSIMRSEIGVPAPSVLISPCEVFTVATNKSGEFYFRDHDDSCECDRKHNSSTMQTCPAAKRLRGEFRAVGFFGKPSKNPCTIWPDL